MNMRKADIFGFAGTVLRCYRAVIVCILIAGGLHSFRCSSNLHTFLSELETGPPASFDDGPVFTNPFGSVVNTFSVFFSYRGMIYIGPSPDNDSFVRFSPDGTNMETVTFSITDSDSTTNTMDTGPDGETGIDCFTAGSVGGTEYLFLGPAKSGGDLNFLYYTSDSSAHLTFSYMDLAGTLTATTSGTESLFIYYDRLYAGYAATATRPLFLKISTIGPSPSEENLMASKMPRIGNDTVTNPNKAANVGIDMMCEYNSLLFIANGGGSATNGDGGIVSSTTNDPRNYNAHDTDWNTGLTPAGNVEWNTNLSIALTQLNSLTPAKRAFPGSAVFNGVLYVARNTTNGPQIWAYNGSVFSLVAGNASYISDMGNTGNDHITLLIVNGDRLYVGYDNTAEGIRIYRTVSGVTAPGAQSDFEQVSSGGLGNPAAITQIFHGISVSDKGTAYLWILCGKSGSDMFVFRTSN